MNCFNKNYAEIYDFLYTEKNYSKESSLVRKILKKYASHAKSLLDLGCGTGQYSNLMTKFNLAVVGLDRSDEMLKIAKKKYIDNKKLSFVKSKIEKFNLKKKFDVVSALFHILSYQTTHAQINKFFFNSHSHLKKNGIIIFDFWYKPGVVKLQSPLRVREVDNDVYKIIRLSVSKWKKSINQIFDKHNLFIINKKNSKIYKFSETHKMRYFTISFVNKILKKNNFKYLDCLDLQTGTKVSNKSWGALIIAKKL